MGNFAKEMRGNPIEFSANDHLFPKDVIGTRLYPVCTVPDLGYLADNQGLGLGNAPVLVAHLFRPVGKAEKVGAGYGFESPATIKIRRNDLPRYRAAAH